MEVKPELVILMSLMQRGKKMTKIIKKKTLREGCACEVMRGYMISDSRVEREKRLLGQGQQENNELIKKRGEGP